MKKILEKKSMAKSRILEYILTHEITSKAELSKELNLSMPTVLSNTNELIEKGLVVEVGEYESTGGRKAKSLGVNKSYCYAMGMDITANHVGIVLVNLGGEVEKRERIRLHFAPDMSYCSQLAKIAQDFLEGLPMKEKVLGIGVSVPGIISKQENTLLKSHALGLENYSLNMMGKLLPLPFYFENDANAAMLAENPEKYTDAVYLSLNNTLGGAICMGGQLFHGQSQKAGEFGHMVLYPGGKTCYCGKQGCADAYCAAGALLKDEEDTLEAFMERLKGQDAQTIERWEKYLDDLAILITNLRMVYDTDIILGGDVGGYLPDHMIELGEKVLRYNRFDLDLNYLKNCAYRKEASAVGVAKYFLRQG
ncbi:MAG: ROK family transcriptional regulator [Clostridia bacterium]|nr:ROK family transcriptional regulator [Clostridia bacterium]NCC42002.1 ROK family transcriptional regulator [Clostridia bacterium]